MINKNSCNSGFNDLAVADGDLNLIIIHDGLGSCTMAKRSGSSAGTGYYFSCAVHS